MTRKIYRTAQGKMVDLGALQLRNENVRAVGNMGVNARGDLVDGKNRAISSRNQTVGKQYARQVTAKKENPIPTSRQAQQKAMEIPTPPEDFEDDFVKEPEPTKTVAAEPAATVVSEETGLAAAIAKARQVKQEPLKTPRQLAQQTPGVRKL